MRWQHNHTQPRAAQNSTRRPQVEPLGTTCHTPCIADPSRAMSSKSPHRAPNLAALSIFLSPKKKTSSIRRGRNSRSFLSSRNILCRSWHLPSGGCRGFKGPVPRPLWIRTAYSILTCNYKFRGVFVKDFVPSRISNSS